ncbi:ribonuclease H-like domain-containing protein, partial [Baffinella frigidus]
IQPETEHALVQVSRVLDEELGGLLSDARIRFVGFEFHQDVDMLKRSFPGVRCFTELGGAVARRDGFLDLREMVVAQLGEKARRFGLAACCRAVLGRGISKAMQASDWGSRPLSLPQLLYAAHDAQVLALLYNRLVSEDPTLPARARDMALTRGG